MRLDKLHQDVS